jgi:hypothetical protein
MKPQLGKDLFKIGIFGLFPMMLFFLLVSLNQELGLPFDDSWIHHVYAKNFAETGQIMYNQNANDLGESSYAWMFVLSVCYLFSWDPLIYTVVISMIFFEIFLLMIFLNTQKIIGKRQFIINNNITLTNSQLSTIIIFTFAWNPVILWMFFNGMATGLTMVCIQIALFAFLYRKKRLYPIILPLMFLSRGETIFLCIGILFAEASTVLSSNNDMESENPKNKAKITEFVELIFKNGLGLMIGIGCYLSLNYIVANQLMPNTFYLKIVILDNLQIYLTETDWKSFWNIIFSLSTTPLLSNFVVIIWGIIICYYSLKHKKAEFFILISVLATIGFAIITSHNAPVFNVSHYYLKYWVFVLPILQLYGVKLIVNSSQNLIGSSNHQEKKINSEKILKIGLLLALPLSIFIILIANQALYNSLEQAPDGSLYFFIIIIPFFVMCIFVKIISQLKQKGTKFLDIGTKTRKKIGALVLLLNLGLIFTLQLSIFRYQTLSYQTHVKEINAQQKNIGLWLKNNTDPDTIIATHDAGAIKYYSERTIIDLWGLNNNEITDIYQGIGSGGENQEISSEEIQFQLEEALWQHCIKNNISFLIIRIDLFLHLTNITLHPELNLVRLFKIESAHTIGNDTMALYSIIF